MTPRSPRHQCAHTFARMGLFKELGTPADLERRIEQLPTEKERGDAFAVFVEAYLSTNEMAQAEAYEGLGITGHSARSRCACSDDQCPDRSIRL